MTVLGVVLSPLIIRAYTIFKGDPAAADQQISIAVPLLIMFMPQVLLYGLDTLFTALLNAKRRFAAPAFAPVLNNIVVICMLLAFHQVVGEDLVDPEHPRRQDRALPARHRHHRRHRGPGRRCCCRP